jgi:hypothetical protein
MCDCVCNCLCVVVYCVCGGGCVGGWVGGWVGGGAGGGLTCLCCVYARARVLFVPVVIGLVTDAFAEVRQRRETLQRNSREFSFVSNLSRDAVEATGANFYEQVARHQNVS